jgi:tetratricopeptide (TPR) repeat protein
MRLSDHVDEPRHQRAAEIVVLARCERGDTRGAAEAAREALARAVAFGDLTAVVTAQAALGAALLHAGRAEEARAHYEAARAGAVELGDVVRTIHVVSDLAGCCFETADYSQCVQLLGEARELADRIGYRRHLAFNLGNEAQLRAALADPYAGACAAAAAECSLEMGDLTATANAVHSWITADVDLVGDERLWRRLRRVDDRLGRRRAAAADAAEMAVAASRAGRLDAVAKLAGRALEAAREADAPDAVRRAQLALSLARTRAGADVAAGGESATTGLDGDPAEHQLTAVERAELAVERWRVSLSPADREAARALLERAFRDEPSSLVRSWFSVLGEPVPVEPMPLPPPAGIGRALASRAELNKTLAVLERAVTGRSSVVSDSK